MMAKLSWLQGISSVTFFTLSLIGLSTLSTGCGGGPEKFVAKEKPPASLVPVKGKITLDGQASIEMGFVVFTPDPPDTARSLEGTRGKIGKGGSYEMFYDENKPGLPKGHYKVSLGRKGIPGNIADEYLSISATPLTVEVTDTPPAGAYDFDVKKK
jgi:hypothetical protein